MWTSERGGMETLEDALPRLGRLQDEAKCNKCQQVITEAILHRHSGAPFCLGSAVTTDMMEEADRPAEQRILQQECADKARKEMKEDDARVASLIKAGGNKLGTLEDRRNVYDKWRALQGLSKEERIERSQEWGMCSNNSRIHPQPHHKQLLGQRYKPIKKANRKTAKGRKRRRRRRQGI